VPQAPSADLNPEEPRGLTSTRYEVLTTPTYLVCAVSWCCFSDRLVCMYSFQLLWPAREASFLQQVEHGCRAE
jgi:hypothetical protein